MSQFGNQDMYAHADQGGEPPRTSGMAIASLVLSLVGIIPCLGLITAPIGALLGLIGVATISPPARGKGIAAAGLLFGLIFFGGQLYLGKMGYDFIAGMMKVVEEGPRAALNEGFAGNYGAFKASFHGPGASATDAEAQAFIDELRRRYGEFQSSQLPQGGPGTMQPTPGQASMPVPYTLTFSNATVNGEAEIVFADQTGQTPGFINKLGYILVKDSDLGDLRFPPRGDGGQAESNTDTDGPAGADSGGDGDSSGQP